MSRRCVFALLALAALFGNDANIMAQSVKRAETQVSPGLKEVLGHRVDAKCTRTAMLRATREGKTPDVVDCRYGDVLPVLTVLTHGNTQGRDQGSSAAAGTIVRQIPDAGTPFDARTPLTLFVSDGRGERRKKPRPPSSAPPPERRVTVPDVKGRIEEDAVRLLRDAQLSPTLHYGDSRRDKGEVYKQNPEYPASLSVGSEVVIWISQTEYTTVPDVVGEPESRARRSISGQRLKPWLADVVPDLRPRGVVTRTEPIYRSRVATGTNVQYWMTSGENIVPRVVGLTPEEADGRLRGAGFTLGATNAADTRDASVPIATQWPEPDTSALLGTVVNVTLQTRSDPCPACTPAAYGFGGVLVVAGSWWSAAHIRRRIGRRVLSHFGFKPGLEHDGETRLESLPPRVAPTIAIKAGLIDGGTTWRTGPRIERTETYHD